MKPDRNERFDGELPAKPKRARATPRAGRKAKQDSDDANGDPSAVQTFEEEGAGIAAKE